MRPKLDKATPDPAPWGILHSIASEGLLAGRLFNSSSRKGFLAETVPLSCENLLMIIGRRMTD